MSRSLLYLAIRIFYLVFKTPTALLLLTMMPSLLIWVGVGGKRSVARVGLTFPGEIASFFYSCSFAFLSMLTLQTAQNDGLLAFLKPPPSEQIVFYLGAPLPPRDLALFRPPPSSHSWGLTFFGFFS